METPDTRPFAFYCRVSTTEQQQNQTIEGQIFPAEDYAKRTGREIVKIYRDDGVNGDLDWEKRPAARQLLADARAGKIQAVGVYLFDRFSRRVLEGLVAARELHNAGVTLFSLLENYDITTPQGEYMFIASLNNAQMNKAMLKQRTSDGQRRKARAGGWLGGSRAAYGYRVEGKRNAARLALDDAPVPEFGDGATRQTLVAWLFDEVGNNRQSCVALSDRLNELEIPAYLGGKWSGMSLARMLRNPVYKGIHQYGDEAHVKSRLSDLTADVPSIVSIELWEKAQVQIQINRKLSAKNRKHEYLLRGLIFCGDCGASYTGITYSDCDVLALKTGNRQGVRYRCNSRASQRSYAHLPPCTGGFSISGEIEHIVWQQIVQRASNPDEVANDLRDFMSAKNEIVSDLPRENARLQKALTAKGAERNAVLALFRKGRIDEDTLGAQLDEINEETKSIEARLDTGREKEQEERFSIVAAKNAAEKFVEIKERMSSPETMSWQERRNIVVSVLDRVTICTAHLNAARRPGHGKPGGHNAEVKIRLKFDPPSPSNMRSSTEGEGQINYIETLL